MYFLNSYEIDVRARQFRDDPIMGPATQTLANLRDWTNRNSDGWAYWPKPTRAAERLMKLIERAAKLDHDRAGSRIAPAADTPGPITAADYRAALVPIRAFLTRQHVADDGQIIITMAQLSLFGRR